MKAFWIWLLGIFGMAPVKIPEEILDDTTAHVEPDNYVPGEIIDDYVPEEYPDVIIPPGDSDDLFDDDTLMDELEDIDEPYVDPDQRAPGKFAVLIGINKYDPSLNSNLNGCVNDVEGMYDILVNTYGFLPDNIRVLTDYRATQEMMLERISWLLDHDVYGDELVLHYSGHGSQIRDRDGDELNDYLDEILCPTDLDWDDPLTDDDIKWIFNMKEDGVFLTFICDSCHSGSITKTIQNNPEGIEFAPLEYPRFISPPLDIKIREGSNSIASHKFGGLNINEKELFEQQHVLLSGCRDNQTSADAYIDGKWQGAMTSSLISAIRKNPNRDWNSIHADVISILNVGGYAQKPQLSGEDSLIKGRNIFGS
jgi:hypothetical protein